MSEEMRVELTDKGREVLRRLREKDASMDRELTNDEVEAIFKEVEDEYSQYSQVDSKETE